MKYSHILSAFAAEPWAMQREKLDTLTRFLSFKAAGGEYSAEEVAKQMTKKRDAEVSSQAGAVGIIPVYGVLAQRMNLMSEISGGTSYQLLGNQIRSAYANPDIKAIVLDIDSPGGAVPGTDELASEIRALRGGDKPIVAQVNALAASAAYWLASAADEIVVTPSGRAGSIGVYMVHSDLSEAMAKDGVKETYIAAGKYKVEGNDAEPLSAEAKDYYQSLVDQSYAHFVGAVADGRGVSKSRVEDGFGQGRIFGASDLVDRGMADRVGTLTETLERFGASDRPDVVRKTIAENSARAEAAEQLGRKMRAGEKITKREFENGLKGLVGCSNSEAERAARLYLKADQGDPDNAAENAVVLAALERLSASADDFIIPSLK